MYQNRAFELHTHLYGCLREEELKWLASRKDPRWHIFSSTYESTYGQKPDLEGIFLPERSDDLRRYSIYESVGNFPEFQCCFDFVISVAHADEEEVYEVAHRLASRQKEPYAEYRMLFGPQLNLNDYRKRVESLCEGFRDSGREGYLVMSLWRGGDLAGQQYELLRELMHANSAVRQRLVGIDFCAQEEGFPPQNKEELFRKVLQDNEEHPESALSILYHVGESFQDKTLESAARWVYQSAELGAHRLGHCIALGQEPEEFLNSTRKEPVSERIRQLQFERDLDLLVSYANDSDLNREVERLKDLQNHWLEQ
ncbi:MAG TPA: adenosine deaminase, partial [Leptospiraceae bacterium]|nr:adenosine deaminase [Leptospiraceae bacterium]